MREEGLRDPPPAADARSRLAEAATFFTSDVSSTWSGDRERSDPDQRGIRKAQARDRVLVDRQASGADRIRHAREFGDIAENAEYDDAKNEQAMLEHRIATLEERLRAARVLEKKDIAKGVVSVGSVVRLKDMAANKTFEYTIVGSAEANPSESKLSNESPVGKAIIGRKKGEVVEVSAPRGSLKYKIVAIT